MYAMNNAPGSAGYGFEQEMFNVYDVRNNVTYPRGTLRSTCMTRMS
jgi:hypothetical protein